MNDFFLLAMAILAPTAAASIFVICATAELRNEVRKVFIGLLYVSPSNWGTSFDTSKQTSRREAFLIVWVVIFIVAVVVILPLSSARG